MRVFSLHHMERIRARIERLYGEVRAPRLMERFCLLAARYSLEGKRRETSWDERDAILIAYGDMVQFEDESPLGVLRRFLRNYLRGVIRTVHLLPFYPTDSENADAIIDHRSEVAHRSHELGHIRILTSPPACRRGAAAAGCRRR